jgi:hypothetical protein
VVELSSGAIAQMSISMIRRNEMVQRSMPTFEDISVTMHHSNYETKSKRLLMSRVRIKGEKVIENN